MAQVQADLPVGITVSQVQDQPKAVSRSVGEFVRVLLEAVAIVMALSFISLGLHTKPGFPGFRIDIWPAQVPTNRMISSTRRSTAAFVRP